MTLAGIDVVPLGLAALAIIVSLVSAVVSYRISKDASRQRELTYLYQYHSMVITWASKVLGAMSDAYALCFNDSNEKGEVSKMLSRLSSLWDEGRFYMPNTDHEEIGVMKESAYRGLRPRAISCIGDVHDAVGDLYKFGNDKEGHLRKRIVEQKRAFTSEIQENFWTRDFFSRSKKISSSMTPRL